MIKSHPLRSLGGVAVIAAVLFLLSSSGNSSFWKNGPGWLGSVGWFGFLLAVLGLIVLAVYLSVARLRHRTR
jgi:drug/metabolite transporter (DMT)-like permease